MDGLFHGKSHSNGWFWGATIFLLIRFTQGIGWNGGCWDHYSELLWVIPSFPIWSTSKVFVSKLLNYSTKLTWQEPSGAGFLWIIMVYDSYLQGHVFEAIATSWRTYLGEFYGLWQVELKHSFQVAELEVPTIFKAYVKANFPGICTQNMAVYGPLPVLQASEIPADARGGWTGLDGHSQSLVNYDSMVVYRWLNGVEGWWMDMGYCQWIAGVNHGKLGLN